MIKLTQDDLRQLYLKDLEMPDVFHGRTTPKVRRIDQWKKIQTELLSGQDKPRHVDPLGTTDVWLWSDIHWGHGNIIKYCNRPFPDRSLMDACLIGNYKNVVKPQDVVIFGGDIGFHCENDINHILAQLPGYKIQIVGNHDVHRDGKVMQLAFNERHLCLVLDVVDADVEYQLLFTHYPMDSVPAGCVNIHGHIHDKLANAWNINICVEHTNYKPKHIKEVLAQARKYIEAHA